jgi:hypothetical protein
MPVFEIEAQGRRFQVDAPDVRAAMSAIGGMGGQQQRAQIDFEGRFKPPATDTGGGRGDMQAPVSDPRTDFAESPQGPGMLQSALLGAGDMAAFGFSDEIAAGLGTGFGFLGDYDAKLQETRGAMQAAQEANPGSFMAGQFAGAVPGALIPAGAALRGASLGTKVARGVAGGAVGGGLYGAGSAEGDMGDRARGAGVGAGIGATLGAALPAAGHAIGQAVGRRVGRSAVPSTQQLRAQSQSLYDAAEQAGIRIQPQPFRGFVNTISREVRAKGIDPTIHPKASAALARLEQAAVGMLDIAEAETLRRVIGQAARSTDPAERFMAGRMLRGLDDFMGNLTPRDVVGQGVDPSTAVRFIGEARKLWKAKAKGDIIAAAIENANSTASGFENGLRIEFRKLLKSPKYNWTPDERKALRSVVQGGMSANALRFLGTFGFSPDQGRRFLGAVVGAGAGASLGGLPGAAALTAAGTAAGYLGRAQAKSRANQVSALVRNSGVAPFNPQAAQIAEDIAMPALEATGRGVGIPSLLKLARGAPVP